MQCTEPQTIWGGFMEAVSTHYQPITLHELSYIGALEKVTFKDLQ